MVIRPLFIATGVTNQSTGATLVAYDMSIEKTGQRVLMAVACAAQTGDQSSCTFMSSLYMKIFSPDLSWFDSMTMYEDMGRGDCGISQSIHL